MAVPSDDLCLRWSLLCGGALSKLPLQCGSFSTEPQFVTDFAAKRY